MADQKFVPGTSVSDDLNTEMELTISGKNLLKKSICFSPHPMCVVYIQNNNSHSWVEHARTEKLEDTSNPEFLTRIQIVYHFEKLQKIKFKIYHMKTESSALNDEDFLGEAEGTLTQLVSSENAVLLKLNHPDSRNKGEICVKALEIGSTKEEVQFEFSAEGFKKNGIIFSSLPDPFLAIYKEDYLLHRTPFIKDTCNPNWPKFTVPLRRLYTKDVQDVVLKLQCWNRNTAGYHTLMGEVQITTKEILQAPATFSLTDKKSGKITGKLCLHRAEISPAFTFLDYIKSGTRLHWTIAIDFHDSNSPLHAIGTTPSPYEQVLQSVVTIIQEHSREKQFPVLGFGAKVPPSFDVSDEFFINMTPNNPYCSGVVGVIDAYRKCLPLIELGSSYCNFVPVINHVNRFAASHPNGDNYFVLVIFTHTQYFETSKTKQAIIAASRSPMSIVVVGIGDENFHFLQKLDNDEGLLSSKGQIASRDIVQFVMYRNFLHQPDPFRAVADLSRAILAEIPDQLVSYMRSKNITAKRPH